jgi:hypothetical protein
MKYVILIFLTALVAIQTTEIVCSEDELIKELLEDIADNNKLDCLRESDPLPNESQDQKALREAADWTGDCSFKSDSERITKLINSSLEGKIGKVLWSL